VIQLTPHMRILLAIAPVDFRKGMDGLAQLCREILRADPTGGSVFCFKNRRGTSVRLLCYDGQGLWLCQKRLSVGTFRWWPKNGTQGKIQLDVHELQLLLWNGNPSHAQAAPAWKPIKLDDVPGEVRDDRGESPLPAEAPTGGQDPSSSGSRITSR
jgi:transposase